MPWIHKGMALKKRKHKLNFSDIIGFVFAFLLVALAVVCVYVIATDFLDWQRCRTMYRSCEILFLGFPARKLEGYQK